MPTPVSALIHAATMVTAGVFLLLRCSILFNYSILMLGLITIIGALTAIVAAMIGISQIDVKKIIAYSTCSQLGYMVFSCGLSNYSASLFHLTNHAFFKALLFLSAGVIIHALQDEQDLRRMGGLVNILPFTYCVMLIGTFAIIGFPFLSGFYSKDVILELNFVNLVYKWEAWFSFFIGLFTAFFTAMYSFKLVILVFFKRFKFSSVKLFFIEEASLFLALPLFVLSIFSIFSGFLFKDAFVGFGSIFFNNSVVGNSNLLYSEFLFDSVKEYMFQSFVSTELYKVAAETNLSIDLSKYDWLVRVLYGSFDDGFTGVNYGSLVPHPAFWDIFGWNVDLSLMREPLYLRFSVYFYLINGYVKFFPLIFTFSGIFVIYFFYFKVYGHVLKSYEFDIIYPYHDVVSVFYFSYKKFYIDFLVNYIFVKFLFKVSYYDTFLLLDRGFLESFGPKNISKFVILFSNNLRNFQTGLFVHYLHYIFTFFILFVFIMFFNIYWSFNFLVFIVVILILFFDFSTVFRYFESYTDSIK